MSTVTKTSECVAECKLVEQANLGELSYDKLKALGQLPCEHAAVAQEELDYWNDKNYFSEDPSAHTPSAV